MLWKPLVACFLPHQHVVLRPSATSLEFKNTENVQNDIESPKLEKTSQTPVDEAWGNTKMIESNGNYLGESFLEVGPLYEHQDELKPLPIPSLQETVKRFLPTALPLVESEEEADSLQKAVDDFESQARVLQARLEDRKEECTKRETSWLQEYWQSDVYLKWRAPLNFFRYV